MKDELCRIYCEVYSKWIQPSGSSSEIEAQEWVARGAAKRAAACMREDIEAITSSTTLPTIDGVALEDGVAVLTHEAVEAMFSIYNRAQLELARAGISAFIDGRLEDVNSALKALASRVRS